MRRQKHFRFGVFSALLTKAVTSNRLDAFKSWPSKGVERAQPFPRCSHGSRDIRQVWDLSS